MLIDLSRFEYPIVGSPLSDSVLPPQLETSPEESTSCDCKFEYADLWLDGVGYNLRAWVGEDAAESDRQDLDTVILSLRPVRTSG